MTENTAGQPGRDTAAGASKDEEERLRTLESQVQTLADAVRVLAHGLEGGPAQLAGDEQAARGARLAHELLLSQGL
jgi:hypothetical protein